MDERGSIPQHSQRAHSNAGGDMGTVRDTLKAIDGICWEPTTEWRAEIIDLLEKAITQLSAMERDRERIGAEDSANPHLLTAGKDSEGHFIYPFLDCDELCSDEPGGKALIGLILQHGEEDDG